MPDDAAIEVLRAKARDYGIADATVIGAKRAAHAAALAKEAAYSALLQAWIDAGSPPGRMTVDANGASKIIVFSRVSRGRCVQIVDSQEI